MVTRKTRRQRQREAACKALRELTPEEYLNGQPICEACGNKVPSGSVCESCKWERRDYADASQPSKPFTLKEMPGVL